MNRRDFLKASLCSALMSVNGLPGWSFHNGGGGGAGKKKLIVILLRGGVDGLNVIVPYGDADYYALRPTIAVARPGQEFGAIDLDGYFGMNPALKPLLPLYQNKSLAFVHASGSPDPSRSHFDAQDFMESGLPGQKFASTGWMNRLVAELPSLNSPIQALSIGPVLPRIMAGPAAIATVDRVGTPNNIPLDRPEVSQSFMAMYEHRHDDLGKSFCQGVDAHNTLNAALSAPDPHEDMEQKAANRGAPQPKNFKGFGKQLANLFTKDSAVQVAFLDFGGWDTHVGEGNGKGQLANKLTPFSQGLADLVEGLGPMFKDTTIVAMSEFGRTAKENGNGGTDHGHGNVMWILGGDINGGKVYSRWPGLSPTGLHENRDLQTTTDFRSVLTFVLNEHIEVPQAALTRIFPGFSSKNNPFVTA